MGKKKGRQQQSSNNPVTVDSSESGDAQETASANQVASKPTCQHAVRAFDINRLKKYISSSEVECSICYKLGKVPDPASDIWLCLRCGARCCSVEHSEQHHQVPRSDSHCLAIQLPDFIVRCHTCQSELSDDCNKKLKVCVTMLRQMHAKGQLDFKNSSVETQIVENKVSSAPTDESTVPTIDPVSSKKFIVQRSAPSPPLVRGLTNLGNTCFFNSVLQCLARTPNLICVFKQMNAPNQPIDITLKSGKHLVGKLDKWDALSESLSETLEALLSGGNVFSPHKLLNLLRKKCPQFEGYDQHDAHELLRHLLDAVRTHDLKRYRRVMLSEMGLSSKVNPQEVSEDTARRLKALDHEVCEAVTLVPEQVFRGLLVSTLQCQECSSTSQCVESFLDLSLPVMSEKPQPPSCRRKNNPSGGGTVPEEKSRTQMELLLKLKEKKIMRDSKMKKMFRSGGAHPRRPEEEEEGEGVEPTIPEHDEKGGSDAEGDVEDNEGCEDKRHESGYSSEKLGGSVGGVETPSVSSASDSARASPSSITEAMDQLQIQPPPPTVNTRPPIPLPPPPPPPPTSQGVDGEAEPITTVLPQEENVGLYICTGLPPITDVPECLRERTRPGYDCPTRLEMYEDMNEEKFNASIKHVVYPLPPESTSDGQTEFDQRVYKEDKSPDISKLLLRTSDDTPPTVRVHSGPTIMREDPDWMERLKKFNAWESGGKSGKGQNPPQPSKFDIEFRLYDINEEEGSRVMGGGDFSQATVGGCTVEKMREAPVNEGNSSLPMVFDVSQIAKGVLAQVNAFLQKEREKDILAEGEISLKKLDVPEVAEVNGYSAEENSRLMEEEEEEEDNVSRCDLYPNVVAPVKQESSSDWDAPEDKEKKPKCPETTRNREVKSTPEETVQRPASVVRHPVSSVSSMRHDGEGECSVLTCLNQFTSIELMTGNNKVGCSTCTARAHKGNKDGKTVYTMSTKQLLIKKAPPVLILHLKRFQVQMYSFRKLSRHVAFPLVLDLAPFCVSENGDKTLQGDKGEKTLLYSLYGVVEHSGTFNGGHYVAYIKEDDGCGPHRWYCISDSHVHEVTESRVLSSQAYLLFYRQLST